MTAARRTLVLFLALGAGAIFTVPPARADFTLLLGEGQSNVNHYLQNGQSVVGEAFTYRYINAAGQEVSANELANGVLLLGGNNYSFTTTTSFNKATGIENYVITATENGSSGSADKITGSNGTSTAGHTGSFGTFAITSLLAMSNSPGTSGSNGSGQMEMSALVGENKFGPASETLTLTATDTGFHLPANNGSPLDLTANLSSGYPTIAPKAGSFNFNTSNPSNQVSYSTALTSGTTTTQVSPTSLKPTNFTPAGNSASKTADRSGQDYTLSQTVSITLAPGSSADPKASSVASLITPEPASLLSMLTGVAALGGIWAWRRKGRPEDAAVC